MNFEKLIFKNGKFYFRCTHENRHLAKRAGLTFNDNYKCWETSEVVRAANLKQYATIEAFEEIMKYEASNLKSRSSESDFMPPCPIGLEYFPFQRAGIEYLKDKMFAINADEMGIGKSIESIGVLNTIDAKSGIIISPISLMQNWQNEFSKWTTSNDKMEIIHTKKDFYKFEGNNFFVLSYGLFQTDQTFLELMAVIEGRNFDVLHVDEAHYLKTPTSKRSINILKFFSKKFKRHYFLSGTPLEGRPVELFPILKTFVPHRIDHMSYWAFAIKYNSAHETQWGWKLGEGKNLDILNAKLRQHCLLRRLKSDVLGELPPKLISYIYLELTPERRKQIKMETATGDGVHIATARKKLGLSKIKEATEYIENLLTGTKKVVVFAWHTDVIDALTTALEEYEPVSITGDTPPEKRDAIKDIFQRHDECRVFIGNIQAAGVGLTLTAASTVVFVEISWTPTQNEQAMDRCHRIGQKDNVNVHFLLIEKSLDDRVISSCKKKWNDFLKVTK